MSDPFNLSQISKVIANAQSPKSVFPKLEIIDPNKHYYASAYYDRLVQSIIDFEQDLDESKEVGARLATFGESIIIHIDDIGYKNPRLIIFHGTDNKGQKVQLIQHVNQISVLLIAVKRVDPNRPRIGYVLSKELEKEKKLEEEEEEEEENS